VIFYISKHGDFVKITVVKVGDFVKNVMVLVGDFVKNEKICGCFLSDSVVGTGCYRRGVACVLRQAVQKQRRLLQRCEMSAVDSENAPESKRDGLLRHRRVQGWRRLDVPERPHLP
jgi:hypothetical protein